MEPTGRWDEDRSEVAAALDVWRDGLVNLSGVNRLVKFKVTKTGALVIDSPAPDQILAGLGAGGLWSFQGTDDETAVVAPAPTAQPALGRSAQQDRVIYAARPHADLGIFLRGLMRRANAEFLDRGLSVLYLAFGMLRWREVDGTEMMSPLVLAPVRLVPDGPKSMPRLEAGEDDTVVNPALVLRVREFGIALPKSEELDELSPTEVVQRVREAVAGQDGWVVEPTVVLSLFSFHKEAMYRDLFDNEQAILDHPVVRALAISDPVRQSGEFLFEPIDPAEIDGVAAPEDTPLVLDADSSQRAAVAAAVAGRSFVMDGPPGTGKSQTIANMIGALLHAGRTVLFVSEKAAALEVVRNRLAGAGLASYLLELHSHKASRREVVAALARGLDTQTQPPEGMDQAARMRLVEQRRGLNDYAAAMNAVREPLSLSLHRVLGMLARLSEVPAAPTPAALSADLTQAQFAAVGESAARLARAWRPALQGQTYLWREIADDTSLEIRLHQVESALAELAGVVEINAELADAFRLGRPGDAATMVALLAAQHANRPPLALDSWLTADDWSSVVALGARLATDIDAVQRAEHPVLERVGIGWEALPDLPLLPAAVEPVVDRGQQLDLGALTATMCTEFADRFEWMAAQLSGHLESLRTVARGFGLAQVDLFAEADKVLTLIELGFAAQRPLRDWLTRDAFTRAWNAAGALYASGRVLAEVESVAEPVFTSAVLSAPVVELNGRFEQHNKGLKKLTGAHRGDREALSKLLAPNVTLDQGVQQLPAAVRWVEAMQAYQATVARFAGALGTYWRGRDTDFEALAEAFTVARRALDTTGNAGIPDELASYLCAGEPSAAYRTLAGEIQRDLDTWKSSLAPAPALSARPGLVLEPISTSIAWLSAHVALVSQAAERIRAVDAATGRANRLADANELLALRVVAAESHAAIARQEIAYAATFGDLYHGPETDVDRLERSLTWAEELRGIVGGPLSGAQVKALAGSRATDNLAAAVDKWTAAKDQVVNAFHPERHPELNRELDDYRTARDLIDEFREDSAGQQEWFAYSRARAELAERGLDAVVDFGIEERLAADQIPLVVEGALLRGWADRIVHDDARLHPFAAVERDRMVDGFRALDRQLSVHATGEIIRAANTLRPSLGTAGEPGLIHREGMKRSRHLPVRDLIARTRTAALAIKPCFMMSPLAVSQYLPADMNFDVVIFDEASQVTPGDAVNCIYRGKALILAGDDKQLPPTSFFTHAVDDSEVESDIADFQSVLELAKGSGAFTSVGLTWHYRSRHEALIAFSNRKFYDDKLVTYPSSHSAGSNVGVAFYHADGVYRRGAGADNPREAAMVAERVIDHFTHRPALTLGVVTFSVPQAEAIQFAVDQAREQRRDLDRFFDSNDRLDAFFVKSLESVQGDERDVIIVSVGYGPDETGRITADFGVVNKPKGWRRLNVAITRARQRVEVVASLRAADIPASDNENIEFFRGYLDYAERGQGIGSVRAQLAAADPLGESLLETVRSWGYLAEPQVGAAGFRIDIGIRHPAAPEVFALGIEYDGRQYHSARAARDRDRLRDAVLRGLGWRLHRVWAIAWYRNRSQEQQRLRAAIEAAIAGSADGGSRAASSPVVDAAVVDTAVEVHEMPSWTEEYRIAVVPELARWVDPSDPESRFHLGDAVVAVAEAEGPVHIDLVRHRLREAWGLGRIGYQVRENIDEAIKLADVVREVDFIDTPNRPVDRVRTPTAAVARRPEQIHDGEIRLAMTRLLRDAAPTPKPDLIAAVARLFDWPPAGAEVRVRLTHAIDQLIRVGEVAETGDDVTSVGGR